MSSPGLLPIALSVGLAALDAVWPVRCASASFVCLPMNDSLSTGLRNCYKVRGWTVAECCCGNKNGRIDRHGKAPAGTAPPVSAKTDFCSISVSEWMPATLSSLPRFKVLLPLLFLCHHACPPPERMMAGPVARTRGMDRKNYRGRRKF